MTLRDLLDKFQLNHVTVNRFASKMCDTRLQKKNKDVCVCLTKILRELR